jgi:glycosyltransferase involved in cell wall biosynthesis
MTIFGMLRVKNEARWIADVIGSLNRVCDRIFVMDDNSTDGTAQICAGLGATVYHSPFKDLDEARDKNWLLKKIEAHWDGSKAWVLLIDGDEVLEADGPDKIREAAESDAINAYSFKILYLWNDAQTVRVDGILGRFFRGSMFRLMSGLEFGATRVNGNLHCSSVPTRFANGSRKTNIKLFHLGYMYHEDRIRKWEWYNRVDPNNINEDRYQHMVIGDILPPDTVTMHAGPLKLESLNG